MSLSQAFRGFFTGEQITVEQIELP